MLLMAELDMASLNISIPKSMKAFVQEQAKKEGFATISEYVRALIRDIQQRKQLDALQSNRRRTEAIRSLHRQLVKLPVQNPDDGHSNREHDKQIYGP